MSNNKKTFIGLASAALLFLFTLLVVTSACGSSRQPADFIAPANGATVPTPSPTPIPTPTPTPAPVLTADPPHPGRIALTVALPPLAENHPEPYHITIAMQTSRMYEPMLILDDPHVTRERLPFTLMLSNTPDCTDIILPQPLIGDGYDFIFVYIMDAKGFPIWMARQQFDLDAGDLCD